MRGAVFGGAQVQGVPLSVAAACSTATVIEDRSVQSNQVVSTNDQSAAATPGKQRVAPQLTLEPSQTANHYVWKQGDRPLNIRGPADGHLVCLITRVSGDFTSQRGRILLKSSERGRSWILQGSPGQNGLSAGADCFGTNEIGPLSEKWDLNDDLLVLSGAALQCKDPASSALSKDGRWATFLSGVSGSFEGGGEWIEVKQSLQLGVQSSLEAHACGEGVYTGANALSFYFGEESVARFTNEFGYRAHAGGGQMHEESMAPVSEAVCGFTYIGGKFNGPDDFVEISEKNGYWFLRAHSIPSDGVEAHARCYSRQQRK
jgi:hypothetical protein